MPIQHVRIYYGPNESFYTYTHRPQKLRGIKEHLQKLGFRVELVPVELINYCVIEMCGHEVFRCNIKNLSFNTSTKRDAVGCRAITAVIDSSAKLLRARSYLWITALIDDAIFRNKYTPKDYWPCNIDKSFSVNLKCVSCCGILKKEI